MSHFSTKYERGRTTACQGIHGTRSQSICDLPHPSGPWSKLLCIMVTVETVISPHSSDPWNKLLYIMVTVDRKPCVSCGVPQEHHHIDHNMESTLFFIPTHRLLLPIFLFRQATQTLEMIFHFQQDLQLLQEIPWECPC